MTRVPVDSRQHQLRCREPTGRCVGLGATGLRQAIRRQHQIKDGH